MNNEGRMVYMRDLNLQGEIVSEQLYGAYIKYMMGGFETTEFMSSEDYEILNYFNYEEDDE